MSTIEAREKLIVSAHMKIEDAIPSLSQLIGYRQRVAQEILSKEGGCTNEELSDLWRMWNFANSDIKKILGL